MATSQTRRTLSASSIIGENVVNRAGDTVGEIEEIMLDIYTGQIAYAVLACGGFLGFGEKLFAVPWNALEVDQADEEIIFDVDKERLEQAPGFDKDNWPDLNSRDYGNTLYGFYGTQPHWD